MPVMPELNSRREQAEAAITAHYRVSLVGATDVERAEWYQRMYELHEALVSVLEAVERASWREAPHTAGALRWAVTGARLVGEHFRDTGLDWLKIAAAR